MNDYEAFARNEPKKLARAIEAGIPTTLRGMLWLLMHVQPELFIRYVH
jgi:ecotropic viral integration site 5 protein